MTEGGALLGIYLLTFIIVAFSFVDVSVLF
jgi:hypothetical protein